MRIIYIICFAVLLVPVAAYAEDTLVAPFTISMTVGEGFKDRMADADADFLPMFSVMDIPDRSGVLYATGTHLRMDITNTTGEVLSYIVDRTNGELTTLHHKDFTAYVQSQSNAETVIDQHGLPLLEPEFMLLHWPVCRDYLEELDSLKHGWKKIRWQDADARTDSYTATLEDIAKADSIQLSPAAPVVEGLNGQVSLAVLSPWETDIPVSIAVSMFDIEIKLAASELRSSDLPSEFFRRPPGYRRKLN